MESDSQRLEKLAAAINLNVDSRLEHGLQYRHVRICFRRIAKLDRTVDDAGCVLQARDVVADTWFGKDEKRGIVLSYEIQCVRAIDTQMAVAHFQVAGDGPCRTRDSHISADLCHRCWLRLI